MTRTRRYLPDEGRPPLGSPILGSMRASANVIHQTALSDQHHETVLNGDLANATNAMNSSGNFVACWRSSCSKIMTAAVTPWASPNRNA